MAGDERPIVAASKLLETLKSISYSLTAAMTQPILDQQVITLYKENSEHEHTNHKVSCQLYPSPLPVSHYIYVWCPIGEVIGMISDTR